MPGRRWRTGFIAWLLLGALVANCDRDVAGSRDRGPTGTGGVVPAHEVIVVRATDGYSFSSDTYEPGVVEVTGEGVVRWVSDSGLAHTVTPSDHDEFERGQASRRGEVMLEHSFTTPGTFAYHCDHHRELGMVGKVIVRN